MSLDDRNVSSDYLVRFGNHSSLFPKGVSMKTRIVFMAVILVLCSYAFTISSAKLVKQSQAVQTNPQSPRDEKLWQRALAIHRKAVVIDSHNDITTPMTNDDYDLGGAPPVLTARAPDRMKVD